MNGGSEKGGILATEEGKRSEGFNRKRAQGRDESYRPKKQPLNPGNWGNTCNSNTIAYVQILGTGMDTQDTSPAVLLFLQQQRFIFNAGEGLQRFCTEHKITLSKIDHIFLSRVCSETAGGLPGLLLTRAGMGDKVMPVKMWGPSDFEYLLDAMKSFIPNAAMVNSHSFGPSLGSPSMVLQSFDNPFVLIDEKVIRISVVLLRPNYEEVSHGENSDKPTSPEPIKHVTKPGDLSVIYICELPEIKGKFDPKRAAALGLRPGPKYGALQGGNPVMSDSQDIMVHPSDVMGPSVPGPIVLLVDCPTLSHFRDLLTVQCLAPYYVDIAHEVIEGSKIVNCVIHLTPLSVTRTDDYRTWMSKFGAAEHIMAGHEMKNIQVPILKASARLAARLNYLSPQFFPSLGCWTLPNMDLPSETEASHEVRMTIFSNLAIILAENLLKFHLRPYANMGLGRSSIPKLTSHSEIIQELLSEIPEARDASENVTRLLSGCASVTEEPWLLEDAVPSCLEDITREDMEIVLLGTGSSQPSKYRNVSSIFINLFSRGSILLDCGEGSLGHLKRRFGVQGADEAIKGLKCIWISHIHADHHTGLASILARRRDLLKGSPHEPTLVVGPYQLNWFLSAYQKLEDLDLRFLDCSHTTEDALEAFDSNEGNPSKGVDSSLCKILGELGLEALVSFSVIHCPGAYGVVLQAASRINSSGKTIPGWKVVYSGDTRPCPKLIWAARRATVLIHEATFEDGMMDEAVSKKHSTTMEAVEMGNSAGAYRIILTHFSQRYPKIPVFDEAHMHKTCVAFDMMNVNLADVHALPRVLPYLKVLFRGEITIADDSEDV
ncbi:tRNAse Z TRZ4, mitochondrial-like [Salvia splendens]|uniref:tRNAse Z TRZ4, mitochondrial-like n=1 Tax=Salvia splendens TaxID=180675 RepID=UPI001C2613F7|nr:tRNAse Z TRZ4, mitochondrial-like [Salvia splendens]